MIKHSVKALASVSVYLGSTVMASAQSHYSWWWSSWWTNNHGGNGGSGGHQTQTTAVPEIDASTGLLAVAAVMAALALAWELKRRRAS